MEKYDKGSKKKGGERGKVEEKGGKKWKRGRRYKLIGERRRGRRRWMDG